jgi:predicted DsbA family dithiol-disulfide isomerase
MIRLDIFSDPVCPWCFIGKAQLDRALATYPDHPFSVQWHPFQLNPDHPAEGFSRKAYLEAKFGGTERIQAMNDRLRETARAAGLEMDPQTPERSPNTLNAHRLIHWAGLESLQGPVMDALFRGYWQEGLDIGDIEILADIAARAGMDRALVLRLLQSDSDMEDIKARDEDARAKGVTAVPSFLIAQQYMVAGSQPPEIWAQIITELAEKARAL